MPQRWVDEHLVGCPACRGWADAAAEVTRRARLVPAQPVPDVTAAVLAQLPATPSRRRRHGWDAGLRLALLAVGAGQLAVSVPALAGGMTGMAAPVHRTPETGAWNLGLAACFLVVAVLPRLAAGALPFLLSFTAVLSWVTLGDLRAGHVHADRAVAHLLLLGGAVLVSALALRHRAPRRGPGEASRPWPDRLAGWRRPDPGRTATGPVGIAADWPRDATATAGERRAA